METSRIFGLLCILGCTACNQPTEETPSSKTQRNNESSAALVSFRTDILPILRENCISCHNREAATAEPMPKSDFSTFDGARPYGSLMPSFPPFDDLEISDQDAIEDWIDNGLTEAEFDNGINSILEENCTSCHNQENANQEATPTTDFNVYQTARKYGALMPFFPPFDQLKKNEQQLIESWVENGLRK